MFSGLQYSEKARQESELKYYFISFWSKLLVSFQCFSAALMHNFMGAEFQTLLEQKPIEESKNKIFYFFFSFIYNYRHVFFFFFHILEEAFSVLQWFSSYFPCRNCSSVQLKIGNHILYVFSCFRKGVCIFTMILVVPPPL